jgi:hypothetical protein
MPLSAAQRRHLVSTYAVVCHLVRQLQEATEEGRSPTGVGSPLSPLPAEAVEPFLSPLRRLQQTLRAHLIRLAPAEVREFERPQGPSSTILWMSNLLDHVREAVDGLAPSKMARYGRLKPDAAREMSQIHESLAALVGESRHALEQRLPRQARDHQRDPG